MKAHMTRPCENCPYRIDAPRRLWAAAEFENVLAKESEPLGTTFGCHKQAELPRTERGLCAGWLLDQKKRGVPSIALRLELSTDAEALAAFEAVTNGGHPMFRSVASMCTANGVPAVMRRRHPRDTQLIAIRRTPK